MNVRKIVAANIREALREMKRQMGPDALIIQNRSVGSEGQVELLVMANRDMDNLINYAEDGGSRYERPRVVMAGGGGDHEVSDQGFDEVLSEIRSMRGAMEAQLSEISWDSSAKRDPSKALVMREMLSAGFSASLSRFLSEKLPPKEAGRDPIEWVKTTLMKNVFAVDDESSILDGGGVFALVGPTGVGKTTTTAKLAARCVMKHGPQSLALITTDGYRMGAVDQLRSFGKILGVMVHEVKDTSDLTIALSELKSKKTILIDTIGMSQRDKMVAEQAAMLRESGEHVQRLLCLNATSNGETLAEVINSYSAGTDLAGCILTKIDEAASIGGVLDILVRKRLKLFYLATGQRVPEDLTIAPAKALVERAFTLKDKTHPFHLKDGELSLMVAQTAGVMSDKALNEVVLG